MVGLEGGKLKLRLPPVDVVFCQVQQLYCSTVLTMRARDDAMVPGANMHYTMQSRQLGILVLTPVCLSGYTEARAVVPMGEYTCTRINRNRIQAIRAVHPCWLNPRKCS